MRSTTGSGAAAGAPLGERARFGEPPSSGVRPSLLTTGPWNRRASIVGLAGSSVLVLVALLAPQGAPLSWIAPTWQQLAAAALAVLIQCWRRRIPVVVLGLLLALAAVAVPLGAFSPSLTVAVAVSIYSCAIGLPRRPAVLLSAGAAAIMLVLMLWAGNEFPANVMAIFLGGAVGDAVKSHRTAMAEALHRAEHAEATREAEALQRVAEDRLSIARDLHDVVAHQIAVINLHAGLAAAALEKRPEATRVSLGVVRQAAQSALSEIGGLLQTLRDPATASTSSPRLDRLDELLRETASRGLVTELRVEGDSVELPDAVDVTAYRLLQEALTNAHKHGTGAADVLLRYAPEGLFITVGNDVARRPGAPGAAGERGDGGLPGTGRGLVGMRERVDAVKGELAAGAPVAPGGGARWVVSARLPLSGRAASASGTAGEAAGESAGEAPASTTEGDGA